MTSAGTRPFHIRTPLVRARALEPEAGPQEVHLKLEALQPSGSFKLRGVGAVCQQAVAAGARHLVSSSGGNAGLAVAYAGSRLGVRVTVFVPGSTAASTRARLVREGAEVHVVGASWDDAHAAALTLAAAPGHEYVHPFDAPALWAGHASMIHEVAEDGLRPDAVVLSVGGGGLLCGVLEGMHAVGWSDVPLVAVETEGASSFHAAVHAGGPVQVERPTSIALSLGARQVADAAFAWTKRHPIVPWLVSDRAAVRACLRFADDQRVLVEPACGAALAAVYDRAAPLADARRVLVIVCGGSGVSLEKLAEWQQATRA